MPYGGAAAGPTCPGTVAVDTNAVLNSSHWYEIVNDTDDDIVVNIVDEMSDSDGNSVSEVHSNLIVPPQSDTTVTNMLSMIALYSAPGLITVTASTSISGAVTTSGSNSCTFSVAEGVLRAEPLQPAAPGRRRLFRRAQRRSPRIGSGSKRRLLPHS